MPATEHADSGFPKENTNFRNIVNSNMAATLKVIVAGFATFVEEFLEEESVQEEEDVLEQFLPLFYANNLLSERRKAVASKVMRKLLFPIILCQSFAAICAFRRTHLNSLL